MGRARLRDLGIELGYWLTGPLNAITDVRDVPRVARTGVTVIVPAEDVGRRSQVVAGYESLNGDGEMTGLLWVAESGFLSRSHGEHVTGPSGPPADRLNSRESGRIVTSESRGGRATENRVLGPGTPRTCSG